VAYASSSIYTIIIPSLPYTPSSTFFPKTHIKKKESMLETNNLYMFGPSTATATSATTATTQPPSSSSTLVNGSPSLSRPHGSTVLEREHHSQQKRPVHYYPQEEDQQPEAEEVEKGYPPSYNNNRFNSSSFGRHHHLEESQPQLNYTYKSNTNHTTKTNPINNRHTTHNHHNQHHHINHHHTPHYLDNHKLNSYSRPTTATTSTNKQPLYPQQQVVKREVSPNILNSPSLIKNSIDVVEEWYDHSVGNKKMLPEVSTTVETGDNKKMKRRKEMNAFIEELNQDFLQNKER
jgi:hypothetical protein